MKIAIVPASKMGQQLELWAKEKELQKAKETVVNTELRLRAARTRVLNLEQQPKEMKDVCTNP